MGVVVVRGCAGELQYVPAAYGLPTHQGRALRRKVRPSLPHTYLTLMLVLYASSVASSPSFAYSGGIVFNPIPSPSPSSSCSGFDWDNSVGWIFDPDVSQPSSTPSLPPCPPRCVLGTPLPCLRRPPSLHPRPPLRSVLFTRPPARRFPSPWWRGCGASAACAAAWVCNGGMVFVEESAVGCLKTARARGAGPFREGLALAVSWLWIRSAGPMERAAANARVPARCVSSPCGL